MPGEIYMRESLRELVANDAYAATFQSTGQYRAALLKHIANRAAADAAALQKATSGTALNSLSRLPPTSTQTDHDPDNRQAA